MNNNNEKALLGAIAQHLNQRIKKNRSRILKDVKDAVRSALLNSPTTKWLLGSGANQLGIINAVTTVNSIINTVASATEIDFVPFRMAGSRISGHFNINMVPVSSRDLPDVSVITPSGKRWDWLSVILNQGLVTLNTIYLPIDATASRSGFGIMGREGSGRWTMPAEHASRGDENWLSRSVTNTTFQTTIKNILERYL